MPPPDPLQSNLPQFNDFVRWAAPYIPNGQSFLNAPSPSSFAELEQRLQTLYDGLYRHEQNLRTRAQWARDDEAANERRWRQLDQEFTYLRDHAPNAVARAARNNAEANDFERRTAEANRTRDILNREAAYWSEAANRNRSSIVHWIHVAIPDRFLKVDRNVLMYAPVAAGVGSVRTGASLQAAMPGAASASQPVYAADSARENPVTSPAPSLQGDISSRIATASQIPPRLGALANDINASRSRMQTREKAIEYMNKRNPELRAEMARAMDADTRLARARGNLERALNELAGAKESYAYRVSEALLWELAKEKVVKPGLRYAASEKMWFGNLDSLTDTQVDALFARGEKAWNGWYVWRGQENFFEVQDKALALIQQNKDFISEAARVLATASPGEIQAFADSVFGRLETNTNDIAKSALRDLTGFAPFDQISHKLAGFRQ